MHLLFCAIVALGATASETAPCALQDHAFLFLDSFLLDKVEGAQLHVNPPINTELVLIADKPWETGGITGYGNVLHDNRTGEYRLYYVPVCWDVEPGFCYAMATSQDGLHWQKPNLGSVEWKGSTENNIVLWAQREGTVIIDPNAPPEARYGLVSSHPELKTRLFTSPDGIHFTMTETPVSSLHSDSQVSTFWDEDRQRYFHYPRNVHEGLRACGVLTTQTLAEPWPEDIALAIAPDERDPSGMDLYTNACQKYPLAPNVYLGFPTPYYHYNPSERAYLNKPTLDMGGKTNDGTIETQLATSRDGLHWTRYRTPYVAVDQYDGLEIKIAQVLPGMIREGDRIYQYFAGYAFTHGDTQVRHRGGGRALGGIFRTEQRVDGFVSLDFDYEGGSVVTEPFTFAGSRLVLNVNTSAAGEARVALLDAAGKPMPGYTLEDSRIINGNYTAKTVQWGDGNSDVSALQGLPVRLHFACRGAKLYAFQFMTPGPPAPYAVERKAEDPVPNFARHTEPAGNAVDTVLGPQLFIDDFLVEETEGLVKTTHSPKRIQDQPILGHESGTTQPYVTVIQDEGSGMFRMWYNRGLRSECAIAYAESEDGIHWRTPALNVIGPDNRLLMISEPFQNGYGVSVIDEGPDCAAPERRFKVTWWGQSKRWPDGDPGLRTAFSPDGLHWIPSPDNPLLPDYGEPWFQDDPRKPYGVGDIIDVFRDPIRGGYAAMLKTPALPVDGWEPGPKAKTYIRRLVSQSVSTDFVHWERPWRVVVPEARDSGTLEFYGVGGVFARGGLLIGFARMLRDDLPAEPDGPIEGIGWTTLVTSRDGRHWERHTDAFFDRNPEPSAWDRAMTWVGSAVPVEEELYLYYGGYKQGHKIEPQTERQLGLAVMPRDRFVSLDAAGQGIGRLRTVLLTTQKGRLVLNLDARGGEVRVRALSDSGEALPGMDFGDMLPVREDGLSVPVEGFDFASLGGAPFRLEFELRNAQLYGFDFQS